MVYNLAKSFKETFEVSELIFFSTFRNMKAKPFLDSCFYCVRYINTFA